MRIDYYDDPRAPAAQRIVPAVTAFVSDGAGRILMENRADNGLWGLPGGVHGLGETIAETVVREVLEETGVRVEVTGLVGIYSDPGHIIQFSDGETRQEFSLCFSARPVGGSISVSTESRDVRWIHSGELDGLPLSRSTRRRLRDALDEAHHPIIA
jgi:8-oxo-dGTP pyrophosphatase MutT (NUDIX family)